MLSSSKAGDKLRLSFIMPGSNWLNGKTSFSLVVSPGRNYLSNIGYIMFREQRGATPVPLHGNYGLYGQFCAKNVDNIDFMAHI